MNRIVCLLVLVSFAFVTPAMALDEDSFSSTVQKYCQIMTKINHILSNSQNNDGAGSAKGAMASDDDFIWVKADEVSAKIESMIQTIESAKGIAEALAVITNLYESQQITVDVAFSMIKVLQKRAIFIRVFVTNGEDELEILINILHEHEKEFSGKMSKNIH